MLILWWRERRGAVTCRSAPAFDERGTMVRFRKAAAMSVLTAILGVCLAICLTGRVAVGKSAWASARGRHDPSTSVCAINSVSFLHDCRDPYNGMRVGNGGNDLTATETRAVTRSFQRGAILVKAAPAGHQTILDVAPFSVYGQLSVHGKPLRNAWVHATFRYRGGTRTCAARTDRIWGVATCSEKAIAFRSRDGDVVHVEVQFAYHGRVYSSPIAYTPVGD